MSETILRTEPNSFDTIAGQLSDVAAAGDRIIASGEVPFGMFEANKAMILDLGDLACITSTDTAVDDWRPTLELGDDPSAGISGFEAHSLN